MFAMFNALFSAIGKCFLIVDKFATAGVHMGTAVEEQSKAYLDITRVNRSKDLAEANKAAGLNLLATE